MLGTLFSFILAILFIFSPVSKEILLYAPWIALTMSGIAILFFILYILIGALTWLPLLKVEQNFAPRILELFRTDRHLKLTHVWLIFFPIASFGFSIGLVFMPMAYKAYYLCAWLVLFGISMDIFYSFFKRITFYLNPFKAVELFALKGKESIKEEKELDLCHWLDAISEIALKAIPRSSSSLCNQCIDDMQLLARNFLASSKSISHHEQDKQSKALGVGDKVSYTLFYLFQRMDLINEKALKQKLEPICSQLVTALGKIVIYAAKFDISLASYPINFLGKFAEKAQKEGLVEVADKATCTYLEVAKIILTTLDVTYLELQEPFISMVKHLSDIARETFRQDKSTNITLLMQPLKDLKELFNTEKLQAHEDTPVIVNSIDQALGEFEALDMVLRTMPPMPVIPEEPSNPDKLPPKPAV